MTAEQAAFVADITAIIANIATALALIPLLIAAVVYIKGRLTKRTLKLIDFRLEGQEQFNPFEDGSSRKIRAVLFNQSKRTLYIEQCFVVLGETYLPVLFLAKNKERTDYEQIPNINIPANSSYIIEGVVVFENNTTFPQNIQFQLKDLNGKVFPFFLDTVSVCETIQMKHK